MDKFITIGQVNFSALKIGLPFKAVPSDTNIKIKMTIDTFWSTLEKEIVEVKEDFIVYFLEKINPDRFDVRKQHVIDICSEYHVVDINSNRSVYSSQFEHNARIINRLLNEENNKSTIKFVCE